MTEWKGLVAQAATVLGLVAYSIALWAVGEALMSRPLGIDRTVMLAIALGWGLIILGLVVLVVILPWHRRINTARLEEAYTSGRALVNVGLALIFLAVLAGLIGRMFFRA